MPSSLSSFVLALALVVRVSSAPLSCSSSNSPSLAPLLNNHLYGPINNSYIVVLKPETSPQILQNHFNFLATLHQVQPLSDPGFAIRHVYDHINGYSGRFSEDAVARLRAMPEVDFIERDQIVHTQATQAGAPWGLARISHRLRLTLATFNRYEHDPAGGNGVDVYVIDTGINILHAEFQGRAEWGLTVPENEADVDGNGHGTHCAGTIASRKYGVAKAAKVIAVKVLGANGSGRMSDVIGGVLYAITSAVSKANAADPSHKGSVINMSLGGGKSRALERAVNGAVDAGLHVAVAAGNDNRDACNYSPAGAEKVVTVGASTIRDERAYFSNHGRCVDVFAPGLGILSTYTGSNYATAVMSGTSMASPHTAGLLAYLLSLDRAQFSALSEPEPAQPFFASSVWGSSLYVMLGGWFPSFFSVRHFTDDSEVSMTITPPQLKKALLHLATRNTLKDVGPRSPNLLIFNNYTA
ncbi:peptidase S8/S53 domain-containing protein [Mycena haematopus]|nr:peptidase S8/S53 domain-containing protein [Mycena haematopus]